MSLVTLREYESLDFRILSRYQKFEIYLVRIVDLSFHSSQHSQQIVDFIFLNVCSVYSESSFLQFGEDQKSFVGIKY